ncbi:hypothetical protein DM408_04940 [Escherichia coli]|nr:hypothetical protein [Escherichia coli]
MKVSEPEERPEKVKPQEYHDAVNQNSNDENVQEKSWSQIQGYSLVAGLRSVGTGDTSPVRWRRNRGLLF